MIGAGIEPVSKYCLISLNIQGDFIAALPIIIASTPVSNALIASSTLLISPLPITGIETAFLTSLIISQFAVPVYIWLLVLPCTAIAFAPALSQAFATSTALMLLKSQPILILTVTGFETALTISETISSISLISFKSAAPA